MMTMMTMAALIVDFPAKFVAKKLEKNLDAKMQTNAPAKRGAIKNVVIRNSQKLGVKNS